MKKTSKKLLFYINEDIEVGDFVQLIDGSSLTCDNFKERELYIVDNHPQLTDSSKKLEDIIGTVVETNVKDMVVGGVCDHVYLQDIVIKLGKEKFRTCSQMVKKIDPNFITYQNDTMLCK